MTVQHFSAKAVFFLTILIPASMLVSCSSIPDGITPVRDFDVEQYMGKWYEIARFDFKFERGLNNTTAEYTLNPDNTVRVVNRGFNYSKNTWDEAVGKAKFRGSSDEAALEVSFFGPFYSGYNVIALDTEYRYSLVAGKNRNYLWILARTPVIPEEIKKAYTRIAEDLGFDTSKLIWVEHTIQ